LSGRELANSLPDKQLQPEFPDNFKLSGNSSTDWDLPSLFVNGGKSYTPVVKKMIF
jgi:hypothetical protein